MYRYSEFQYPKRVLILVQQDLDWGRKVWPFWPFQYPKRVLILVQHKKKTRRSVTASAFNNQKRV